MVAPGCAVGKVSPTKNIIREPNDVGVWVTNSGIAN